MDKKEILKILKESAINYKENLKDNNFLVIYKEKDNIEYIELVFLSRNFMHLTGVKCVDRKKEYMKANQFYQACINNKLSYKDIIIKHDGTTKLKLDILSQLIHIDKKCKMIGEFNNCKKTLMTEMLLGNINMCLGLTKTSSFYMPNTLLKDDIRKLVINPYQVMAVLKKKVKEEKYQNIIYINKKLDIKKIEKIELINKINIKR